VSFSQTDYRSAIVCHQVEDLVVDGLKTRVLPGSKPVILLQGVKGAWLRGGVAPAGTGTYLRVEGDSADVRLDANDLRRAEIKVSLEEGLPSSAVIDSDAQP